MSASEPDWVRRLRSSLGDSATVTVEGRRVLIQVRYDPALDLRRRLRQALSRLNSPPRGWPTGLDRKTSRDLENQLRGLIRRAKDVSVVWNVSLPLHPPDGTVERTVSRILEDIEKATREAESLQSVARKVLAYVNEFLRSSGR